MLRAPQVKALVQAGAIQLSLFDETNLATSPRSPIWTTRGAAEALPQPGAGRRAVRKRAALLAEVEADSRCWKATDLQLRPIYHWTEVGFASYRGDITMEEDRRWCTAEVRSGV